MRKAAGFPPIVQNNASQWEDGEMAWHPDGADVPDWAIGAAIAAAGVVLLMAICIILAGQPANRSGQPGPSAVPTTYGAPRG